jgi:hypothetical protein
VKTIAFDKLTEADLVVDATYSGGSTGTVADDPLARLLPGGNLGGFRFKKHPTGDRPLFLILYSDFADTDWPDTLDLDLGRFVYYGDNKKPGHALHQTPKGGNRILRDIFAALHASPPNRELVPPIFVFGKGALGRDVQFRGLAVPGARDVTAADDLIAVWRTTEGERFQNYRAIFTILDVGTVTRAWIAHILDGDMNTGAPSAWLTWVNTGTYRPLTAPRTLMYRTKAAQLPKTAADKAIIAAIHSYFGDPFEFEKCAAFIWAMEAPSVDYEARYCHGWRYEGMARQELP